MSAIPTTMYLPIGQPRRERPSASAVAADVAESERELAEVRAWRERKALVRRIQAARTAVELANDYARTHAHPDVA